MNDPDIMNTYSTLVIVVLSKAQIYVGIGIGSEFS